MELIAQGAEAKIHLDNSIIRKERFEKTYRHPELDRKLRKSRTKREAKILIKLAEAGFPVPKLIEFNDELMEIQMEFLEGKVVKDILTLETYEKLCEDIGSSLAKMHNLNIIHHDLTTSNMILNKKDDKVYFIDFGLSFFSRKIEDKAVDLHLLHHALESRHHEISQKCFEIIKKVYGKTVNDFEDILTRLDAVEKRGRYKRKH